MKIGICTGSGSARVFFCSAHLATVGFKVHSHLLFDFIKKLFALGGAGVISLLLETLKALVSGKPDNVQGGPG